MGINKESEMLSPIFLAILFILTLNGATAKDCPANPENQASLGGHCYFPSYMDSASKKTIYKEDSCFDDWSAKKCNWNWDEARAKCQSYSKVNNGWTYDLISIQSRRIRSCSEWSKRERLGLRCLWQMEKIF